MELRHKYNVRPVLICKVDEVQVDWDLLLRAASQVQRLFRVKKQIRLEGKHKHIRKINQVQINPKVPEHG